jgi:hypothetical protein
MTWEWSASGHLTKMVVGVSLFAGSACASNPPYQRDLRTDPRDHVVNQRPVDAARHAPGAPSPGGPETPPTQPGADYSWGSGQHTWDGSDFQGSAGERAVPPAGYYAWTAGSWQKSGSDNWVYVEGHWQ